MKTTTKLTAVTLAAALLAAASIVSAHPGGGYGMGYGPGMGPGAGMMGQGYGSGAGMGPGFAMGGMHGLDSPAVMTASFTSHSWVIHRLPMLQTMRVPWPSRIATRPSGARLRVERLISICMAYTSSCCRRRS